MYAWIEEFGRSFFRFLLVDHQIVEDEDVVLVTNGAAIFGVDEYKHGGFPL